MSPSNRIAQAAFRGINVLGLVMSPLLLPMAAFANLDPRTEADGIRLSIACLGFPALSLAGLLLKRRSWLGAIGLAVLIWAFSLASGSGMMTEAQRDAYRATEYGDAALLRTQLAAGVDPDLYIEDKGYLLTAAVISKNPDLVKILIDAGADVNVHKGNHITPLLLAVYIPNCEAALPLARAGASFEHRFYDNAELADLPTYRGKNVAEIYFGRKRDYAKSWKQDEACWLQFEAVLKRKTESLISTRRPARA